MKDFSMFEHAMKFAADVAPVEDLGDVPAVSRRDFDERATFAFRSQVPCLEYVSLMIENALLLKTDSTGRIYAGFERLSRMSPIIDRYLRIADLSERVFVFGEQDWTPPRHPRMKTIAITGDSKIAREWFVISDSRAHKVALVATDEDGFDVPVLEARRFRAMKTHNARIVAQLANDAENLIDRLLTT